MARKPKTQDATTAPANPVPGEGNPVDTNKPQSPSKLTAASIRKMWNDDRADVAGERLQYWLNRAFWLGEQWLWIPDASNGVIEPIDTSAKKRRAQPVVNKIQPALTNTTSRLMKVPLTFEVLAKASDDLTEKGAQVGEALIGQKQLDEDWEVTKELLVTATLIGGTAALVTDWDPSAHQYSPDVATGDAKLSVLSVEEFAVEAGSKDAKTARRWTKKQVLPPAAVQALYKLPELPTEDGDSGGPFAAKVFQFSTRLNPKKGTQVLTYYERPNFLRPEGAIAVVVGNEIVWGPKPWPFPFKDHLNIEVARAVIDTEKWAGETPVTQAIGPQRQLNHLWAKIHETTHRTAGAKPIYHQVHADAMKDLNDDPEDPIVTNAPPNFPDPHYMTPPVLPQHVSQDMEKLEEAIKDALGVHDISQGETPANSPDSGYGLSLLAENDATPAGRLAKEVVRCFAGSATNILECYADKVTDKRTTPVSRKGSRLARPVKWDKDTLAGQTRVVVPPDSVTPTSHAGMLKLMTDLLNSPLGAKMAENPLQFFRMAMVPNVESLKGEIDSTSTLAEDENYLMGDSQVVVPNDWDDHAKHIQVHNNFRNSRTYFQLPEKDRQIINAHIQAHKAYAAHEAGQSAAAQGLDPALAAVPGHLGQPQMPLGAPPGAAPAGPELPPSGAEPFVPQVPEGAQ